jgi:protease I
MNRDSLDNERPAFVVEDRNYVSARWPGDAHTFAKKFYQRLKQNC